MGNTWTALPTAGAPAARQQHTAVWSGSEMIVWGGTWATLDASGGRYNPATNTWMPMQTTGAPAGRAGHVAVWNSGSSEMIAWGGEAAAGVVNTGGRYNPAANAWSTITTTGAPSARTQHTAVVTTDGQVIVWGGRGNNATPVSNTGARFFVSANGWLGMTTTGAPAPRIDHTAVWTGTEMIVWGGFNTSPLGDGARYRPSTDSWATMTATNAPSARRQHVAAWTGSEMIVWGGNGTAGQVNDGARYNPMTDAWTPMTTLAPQARSGATAQLGSGEVLIFGGSNGTTVVNTGGRYSLGMDAWAGTALTGAPSARDHHAMVWTGADLIVWGGANATGGPLGDGARFRP